MGPAADLTPQLPCAAGPDVPRAMRGGRPPQPKSPPETNSRSGRLDRRPYRSPLRDRALHRERNPMRDRIILPLALGLAVALAGCAGDEAEVDETTQPITGGSLVRSNVAPYNSVIDFLGCSATKI